jgi:hypothetical protein
MVPLLPEFFAVLFDLSERHLEARQLGFSRRQLGSECGLPPSRPGALFRRRREPIGIAKARKSSRMAGESNRGRELWAIQRRKLQQ